jgi:hypothetical protein
MSATGRGAVRAVQNFYPTPAWCVRRLLEGLHLPGGEWLEAGAGEGHIIRAVNARRNDVHWTAVELREECRPLLEAHGAQVEITDFLRTWKAGGRRFRVGLGNPPFPLTIPFVEAMLACCDLVVLLLSTGILGSEERAAWWPEHQADQLIIPDRISFRGTGADTTTCAWFVWDAGALLRPWGRYRVLPHTPRQEQLEDLGQLSLFAGGPAQAELL